MALAALAAMLGFHLLGMNGAGYIYGCQRRPNKALLYLVGDMLTLGAASFTTITSNDRLVDYHEDRRLVEQHIQEADSRGFQSWTAKPRPMRPAAGSGAKTTPT